MSSAGRAGSSSGCVTKPKERETGSSGFAVSIQVYSLYFPAATLGVNNMVQKGPAFVREQSGTVTRSEREARLGILPRRLHGRGGAVVVAATTPFQRNGRSAARSRSDSAGAGRYRDGAGRTLHKGDHAKQHRIAPHAARACLAPSTAQKQFFHSAMSWARSTAMTTDQKIMVVYFQRQQR
jgi:hypothetical protein